jgi:hypothetical protein
MKGRKALLMTGGVLVALVLIAIGIWTYLGFMPGLSRIAGTGKPRDLGIELSVEQAYGGAAVMPVPTTRAELEDVLANPDAYTRFDATMTNEQASSMLLVGQSGIPNWPLSLVQLRFNADGTAEASGILNTAQAVPFMLSAGVSQENADKVANYLRLVGQAPFYVKGSCSVANNTVDLSLSQVQIGKLTVPAGMYQGKESQGTPYITNLLDNNGFMVESLSTADGTASFAGTQPISAMEPWLGLVGDYTPGGE